MMTVSLEPRTQCHAQAINRGRLDLERVARTGGAFGGDSRS